MFWRPTIGDRRSRLLAARLVRSADQVVEPQRSRIVAKLPGTVFISHTSRDNEIIGTRPSDGLICGLVWEYFEDPFMHSVTSGAAREYEKIVGLALSSAARVLVVWTANAIKSDYVRAEILLASSMRKTLAAFCLEGAPDFPVRNAEIAKSPAVLRQILDNWRSNA